MRPTDALPHPPDWTVGTIGKTIELRRGVSWSKDQERPHATPDTVPVLGISNIQSRLDLSNLVHLSGVPAPVRAKKRASKGWSILVGSNGNRNRIGNAVFQTEDTDYLFASFLLAAMPKSDSGISPEFFFRWLCTHEVQSRITASSEGSTGLSNLAHDFFKAMEIAYPRTDEQAGITRILDAMDDAIERTRTAIEKAQRLQRGLMRALLSCGLDAAGRIRDPEQRPGDFQSTVNGRFPKMWSLLPLKKVADVQRGKFTHRPRNEPRFYGGQHPFIQTGDITRTKGRRLTTYTQTLNDFGAAISREFPVNTIAVTIAANIADTTILSIPMFFPDSIVGVVVYEPHNPRYVEMCIRKAKPKLDARAPQSAQKNINLKDLNRLLIPVPEPDEQNQIAEVYENTDTLVMRTETCLEELIALKRGLMQDLLTGKVRVGANG